MIDADALKETIDREIFRHDTIDHVFQIIDDAPSIDIVRCKECKYHKPSKIWAEIKPCIVKPFPSMRCKMLNREVNADDFCSYGQKGDENVETD